MAERMDLDKPNPPSTRDPRLSRNKPTLSRALSSDVGASNSPSASKPDPQTFPSPPTDKQALASGDQLLRGLSELIKAAADSVIQNAEKEKLVKKKETTEGLLKKARMTPSFPSIITHFQQVRNKENSDLMQMDDTINKRQSEYRQLESSFTTKLAQSLLYNSNTTDERLEQLQSEIRELKKQMKGPVDETKSKSLEMEVKILRDRLTFLEKTSGNHTTSINLQMRQGKETTQRIDQLASELAQLPSESTAAAHVIPELEELKRIQAALDAKIRSFEFVQAASQSAESTLEKRLVDVEHTIASFSMPDLSSFDSKIQTVSENLNQLQNLQAMKDELHFAELEELKKATLEKTEVQSLKENYARLAEETKRMTEWSVTATRQSNSHGSFIERNLKTLQSLQVGLHSLETRYNHLSTEPFVQNTITAIQELYPPAAQLNKLMEQIAGLRNEAKEEIPPLKRTVQQLVQSQNSQENSIKQLQEEAMQHTAGVNQLRDLTGNMSSRATEIHEQLIKADLRNKMQQLHANFDSLTERYREDFSKIQEQTESKDEANAQTKNVLEESCRKLREQVQNLSKELEQISHTVAGIQDKTVTSEDSIADIRSITEQNTQTASSQQVNLESLIDRFGHFEKAILTNHQGLLAQIEALKETSHAASQCSSVSLQEETVPESRLQSPKREESLAISDTMSQINYAELAESNPTLALREKKRKKKRPRLSGLSEDERPSPAARNNSPRAFPSPSLIIDAENSSLLETKKRSKKKKKRKLQMEGPIMID